MGQWPMSPFSILLQDNKVNHGKNYFIKPIDIVGK